MARTVKYIVEPVAYWSKLSGTSEHACTVTRTADGKRVSFRADSESNVISGVRALIRDDTHAWYPTVLTINTRWLPRKEFKAHTAEIPRFGGFGEDIAKQIRVAFRKA